MSTDHKDTEVQDTVTQNTQPEQKVAPTATPEPNNSRPVENSNAKTDPQNVEAALASDTEQPKNQETDFVSYNDPAADAAVALMKKAGVTPVVAEDIFGEAVKAGDLSKIKLDKLVEKVGKETADLIMIGVKDFWNRNVELTRQKMSAIENVLGGPEQLAIVKDWAHKRAETDQEFNQKWNELRAMADIGPFAAQAMAKELRGLYESAEGNSALNEKMVSGDSTVKSSNYISAADALTALKVAHRNNDYKEVERITALRNASRLQEQKNKG